jgi:ATPase domain predominantly from Archaea
MASVMAFKQPDADLLKVVNPCDPSLTVTELASCLTAVAAIPSTERVPSSALTDAIRILDRVLQLLHLSSMTSNKPVIVIDEANVLQEWPESDMPLLQSLLRWFVSITKESKSCHVVMVTSDYTFQKNWLRERTLYAHIHTLNHNLIVLSEPCYELLELLSNEHTLYIIMCLGVCRDRR